MRNQLTAQQVVDRIREHLGVPWNPAGSDVFHAGNPDSPITGIATSFTPSLEVLRRAVAENKNLIAHERGEEPGMKECADWLRTFTHEVPVEFIDSGEPFWIPS